MTYSENKLFSDEGQQALREVVKPRPQASTLPAEAYWSPEIFEKELDEIFRKEWICIGRQEDVPEIGDYFTTTIAREPLIVVKDKSGQVRTLLNVCRHRGCEVARGAGQAKRFRCAYHGWSYGLDGKLKAAPNFKDVENFELSDHPLHSVRTEIWEGFIMVNLDHEAEPFAPRVSEMNRWDMDKYAFSDKEVTSTFSFDVTCNWKAYVENGMEEYHTPWVHTKTLQPFMPMEGWAALKDLTDQPWSVMIGQFPGITMSPTGEPLFPIPESFSEIDSKFNGMPIANIFPNLLVLGSADTMIYLVPEPIGPEKTRVWARLCVPKESAKAYRAGDPETVKAVEAYADGIPAFMAEDNEIAEMHHRGLKSRLSGTGRYGGWESLAWRFVNWVTKKAYT